MQGFARATSYIPSQVSFTTTGNIDNLDFSGADLIRMNNASDATIRGLVAGTPGQTVTIVSIGAGNVLLAHQNTNSTAANRLLNYATSADTPLAAGSGTAVYRYDGTTQRWRLIQHEQGAWITQPFNAGDFTASGLMTWTVDSGDVTTFRYILRNKTLAFTFYLLNTTVGGTASNVLRIKIPGGFTNVFRKLDQTMHGTDGATGEITGFIDIAPAATTISVAKNDVSNWTLSTNATNVYGTAVLEVT